MHRRHAERAVVLRRARERKEYLGDVLADAHPGQLGRYRKSPSLGCGNARCGLCHRYKFPRRTETRGEAVSRVSFREQVRESAS